MPPPPLRGAVGPPPALRPPFRVAVHAHWRRAPPPLHPPLHGSHSLGRSHRGEPSLTPLSPPPSPPPRTPTPSPRLLRSPPPSPLFRRAQPVQTPLLRPRGRGRGGGKGPVASPGGGRGRGPPQCERSPAPCRLGGFGRSRLSPGRRSAASTPPPASSPPGGGLLLPATVRCRGHSFGVPPPAPLRGSTQSACGPPAPLRGGSSAGRAWPAVRRGEASPLRPPPCPPPHILAHGQPSPLRPRPSPTRDPSKFAQDQLQPSRYHPERTPDRVKRQSGPHEPPCRRRGQIPNKRWQTASEC